jgi:hypothetical protein
MINVSELEGRVLPIRFRPQSAFLLSPEDAVKSELLCNVNIVYSDIKKGEFVGVGYENIPGLAQSAESTIRGRLRQDGLIAMTKEYTDESPFNGLMMKYRGTMLNQRDHIAGQGIYFLNDFSKVEGLSGLNEVEESELKDFAFGTWRLY